MRRISTVALEEVVSQVCAMDFISGNPKNHEIKCFEISFLSVIYALGLLCVFLSSLVKKDESFALVLLEAAFATLRLARPSSLVI